MFGALELLTTVVAGGLGFLAFTLLVLKGRRDGIPKPVRPRPPVIPLLAAASCAGAAVLIGLALSSAAIDLLLAMALPSVTTVTSGTASDAYAAQLHVGSVLATWFALPWVLAVVTLLAQQRRSWVRIFALSTASWHGFAGGLAAGVWLLPTMLQTLFVGHVPGATVSMHELVETSAAFLMTFGVVGACGPSVFVVAAGSQTGMRRMLLATLGMPGGALLFGAIYTPPDVLTQMLAAAMVAVSWLLGLAAGVSARLLLGQRRHAGDRS
jgi:hypothetical protein